MILHCLCAENAVEVVGGTYMMMFNTVIEAGRGFNPAQYEKIITAQIFAEVSECFMIGKCQKGIAMGAVQLNCLPGSQVSIRVDGMTVQVPFMLVY